MALLDGMHHVATITSDLDRLADFYSTVFDAEVSMDMQEGGLRHAFIEIGRGCVLHPFQLGGGNVPPAGLPMFRRGRLDHIGLSAPTREALLELRRRVVAAGAGDGRILDFGSMWSLGFRDPDGLEGEVIWRKPGVPDAGLRPRAQWQVVAIPEEQAG